MKLSKKLTSILCAAALLVSVIPAAAADQPNEPHYDDEVQEQAILAYNVLLDYFGRDDAGFPDYPDDFGGAYYDGERLVVLTTAPLSEKQGFYEDLLTPYSVEIKTCEFSYNELNENGRAVAESLDVPLVRYGVNERTNNFNIVVEGEENLGKVKNYATRSAATEIPIVFEAGEPIHVTSSLIGGGELKYNGLNFSVGLCGTWKGLPAVLTCGHAFYDLGTNIRHVAVYDGKNKEIGTLESFSAGPGHGTQTAGDWAIILLNDSTTPTNKVYTNKLGSTLRITQKAMAVPEGVKLYGSGKENRKFGGVVFSINQQLTIDDPDIGKLTVSGITISGIVEGGPYPEKGDSGGTCYFTSNGENTFYGTVTGGNNGLLFSSPYYWATNFAPKTD